MQVTETLNDGLKRGYQITVTAAELDAKVTRSWPRRSPRSR
jgi:trigger factor